MALLKYKSCKIVVTASLRRRAPSAMMTRGCISPLKKSLVSRRADKALPTESQPPASSGRLYLSTIPPAFHSYRPWLRSNRRRLRAMMERG